MRSRTMLTVALVAVALLSGLPVFRPLQAANDGCSRQSVRCPKCCHSCRLEVSQDSESKKCFECETKTICIPRVVFPWQNKKSCKSPGGCVACGGKGCTVCRHNGAKVRRVKVLKTKSYECPRCKYKWMAETCGARGHGRAGSDCTTK